MSKKLSIEALTKKLKNVSSTQDSITMFSLWVIHHKAHHDLIVKTWLDILKNSKPKHRLTLWYLANDVIQNCSRKKANILKESFANVLPEAIALLRDKSIQSGVERVLKVWSDRNIYDTELIDQLLAALITNRTPDTLRQKLLVEYKPMILINAISTFKKQEDAIIFDEKHLSKVRVDASSSEDIHKLKDKIGGEKFSRNFEESATNIEKFIEQYEKYIEERKSLLDKLSQGVVFYRAQYQEAKIVVNAYQNFNVRVQKTKKILDRFKKRFSPKPEPIIARKNDDDMEMSDSDEELGNKPSNIVAIDTNVLRPIPVHTSQKQNNISLSGAVTQEKVSTTVTNEKQQSSGGINRPGMRGASSSVLLSTIPDELQTALSSVNALNVSTTPLSKTLGKLPGPSPSASPPSPTDSPDLNISSPPRHQSLESRLADIFSGNQKGDTTETENTGSESESESLSGVDKPKSILQNEKKTVNSFLTSPLKIPSPSLVSTSISQASVSFSHSISTSSKEDDSAWQNAIPVIGGNRNLIDLSSLQQNNEKSNMSTPVRDERSSPENYFSGKDDTINETERKAESEFTLPPPSFSGDALNFLTKFMGQKTNTDLTNLVTSSQSSNVSSWSSYSHQDSNSEDFGHGTVSTTGVTTWNIPIQTVSPQKTATTGISWLRECISSVTENIDAQQQERNNGKKSESDDGATERDTDYRMKKLSKQENNNGDSSNHVDDVFTSLASNPGQSKNLFHESSSQIRSEEMLTDRKEELENAGNEFANILRRKSSEQTPTFAPRSARHERHSFSERMNNENNEDMTDVEQYALEERMKLENQMFEELSHSDLPGPTMLPQNTAGIRKFPPNHLNRPRLRPQRPQFEEQNRRNFHTRHGSMLPNPARPHPARVRLQQQWHNKQKFSRPGFHPRHHMPNHDGGDFHNDYERHETFPKFRNRPRLRGHPARMPYY